MGEGRHHGLVLRGRDKPVAGAITRLALLPFDAQPGKKYVYGYSTDILGVVERAAGQSLDQVLRSRVIEPLQMRDTHFYLPREKADRPAVVYSARARARGWKRAPVPGGMVGQGAYVEGPRKGFSGGAGLLSTANDYARFLQMMLDRGQLGGVRVLGRKSVELMTVDHLGPIDFRKGHGFGLDFSVLSDVGLRGSKGEFAQLIPARDLDDHDKLRALVYSAIVD